MINNCLTFVQQNNDLELVSNVSQPELKKCGDTAEQ